MREFIHGETIKKYFMDCYGIEVETKGFTNNVKNETLYAAYWKGANLALLTEKEDGTLVCIDSNGEPVSEDNIFVHAKKEDVQIENGEILFQEDRLRIFLDGEEMDKYYVNNLEEKIYPERTSIVLNNFFKNNAFSSKLQKFYVDEIAHVNDDEFSKLCSGELSERYVEYNQKHYESTSDGVHGLLFLSQSGDGLMVNTEGYDYPRYMAYAPQIAMPVEYMLEQEMQKKANIELKLYSPLMVTEPDENGWSEVEVNPFDHFGDILKKVRSDDNFRSNRGLAKYLWLWEDKICRNKVYSIKPDVERINGQVMGVAIVKITEPLNEAELDDLKNYITGQFADGWGESFEQHEVKSCGREIYVHFWNSENYYIKTEEEMNQEQERRQESNQQTPEQDISM